MSTLLFWFGIGVVGLMILMLIPGIREVMKPFLDLFAKGLGALLVLLGTYLLWLVQRIFRAHVELGTHLVMPRTWFDPTSEIRQEVERRH